jgi:hypothetical protein
MTACSSALSVLANSARERVVVTVGTADRTRAKPSPLAGSTAAEM